jgi:hypothetical protein
MRLAMETQGTIKSDNAPLNAILEIWDENRLRTLVTGYLAKELDRQRFTAAPGVVVLIRPPY